MTGTESPRAALVERGLDQLEADRAYRESLLAQGIAKGKHDLRRSFVFRFYHNTMLDTHLSGAYHRFGPDSPDPLMTPIVEPGWMGGQYCYVPWEFEHDGLRWRAAWRFGYEGGASPEFFIWARMDREHWEPGRIRRWVRLVRIAMGHKEWREVHSPRWVAEILA